ncbi:hypothetical protein GGQ86_000365 [Xanthobacter flavus]|uniref:Uncharacterized protein n=1 Tax=Xanthobacter flavus TaxID=281 RepID=A0A9W6CTX6_XANFL|nr:hypothetical protein [Xanthobacter flavus]MDR6331918.1 hypothetical protein [Xanthobacter flavus]GLI25670.1 hypothetical protein XFLAVUS301_53440 [Xanthobacter flavus]
MARVVQNQAEFNGQGAIGAAGRGPEGSLAGVYAGEAAGLDQLGDAFGRLADRQAATEGEMAGAKAGLEGKPELTGRSSIYGANYEMAALRTYADRLDTKQMEGTFAVYQQHRDDPGALAKGLADLKQKMLSEDVLEDPRARAIFERQFTRSATIYQREALERADTRMRQQVAADATTAYTTSGMNLQRLGRAAGLDPATDADLEEDLKRNDNILDRAVASGAVTPQSAAALKLRARKDLAEARVKGQFAKMPEADRPAFASKVMDEWQNGKGPLKDLDFEDASRLSADLERDLSADRVRKATASNVLEHQAQKIQRLSAQGYDIADTEWKQLESAAGRVDGGPQTVDRLRQEAATFRAWRNMRPDALDRALDQERAKLAKNGADELAASRLAAGETLLKEMRTQLAADPLGWAERTGTAQPVPLDLNDPGTAQVRIAQAQEVARHYNVAPVYLRPEDRAAISAAQAAGGQGMVATARAIVDGFGDLAPRVFAEASKEAPLLARVGALASSGAASTLMEDVATTLGNRATPGHKAPGWAEDKARHLAVAANEVYGSAFSASPSERETAETLARTAFETRVYRRGFVPKLDDTDTLKGFKQTLQEAAGASFDADGRQYGGVATRANAFQWHVGVWRMPWQGEEKVLVPPNMRADRFDRVVDAIRDEDLTRFGPVAGGKPLSADMVRLGHLVAVKPGQYLVAQGDPGGDDPQYVARADGRPYILDLDALEGALRSRVPSAYRGSR